MQDPKYKVSDAGWFHVEGGYYIPTDEPLMTLRGKDPDAPVAILDYIARCLAAREDPNALAHAASAAERLAAFLRFQADHPERTRRGCHQCDDKTPTGG